MLGETNCVPQLEVRAHAQQHQIAIQLCRFAKFGRHEQAAGAVEIDIGRIAEQQSPQRAGGVRPTRNLLAPRFPCGARIDQQTTIGVAGHREPTVAAGRERVTMSARHRQPSLAVERQLRSALEHVPVVGSRRGTRLAHYPPLFYTARLYGVEERPVKGIKGIFECSQRVRQQDDE